MKKGQTRRILEDHLIEQIDNNKHDKHFVDHIKQNMLDKYQVTPGETQKYINHAEDELAKMDLRLLCVFAEQTYLWTKVTELNIHDYFTDNEIKQARLYSAEMERNKDSIKLPITLDNVLMIDDENYITTMDIKFIKELFDNQLLRYNFDTQREAKFVRRQDSIDKVANINMQSVKEITQLLLQSNLSPTTITFNALEDTADGDDELMYDARKQQLTIMKGTIIDILDGYHRISGALNALEIDSSLDFKFMVSIKNYDIPTAQKHLAEINTVNTMSKTHVEALKATRYADKVMKQLQKDSDLKGRISQTSNVHTLNNEIVAYNTLADAIEKMFPMESKKDAKDVAAYLTEFFDYLIGSYPDEFINNVKESSNYSWMNYNMMFAGYVTLAKRLKDENIPISHLTVILDQIDFNKNNDEWEKLGVFENKRVTNKTKKKIVEYFSRINLKEGVPSES